MRSDKNFRYENRQKLSVGSSTVSSTANQQKVKLQDVGSRITKRRVAETQ